MWDSNKPTYHLSAFQYPVDFSAGPSFWWSWRFPCGSMLFPMTKCSGISFTEGDSLWYAISASTLIAYQKLSLLLDLTSRFSSLWKHAVTMGQRSTCLTEGPCCSMLTTNFHCPKVISDKLNIHSTLKIWYEFYKVQETISVFKDPIRITAFPLKRRLDHQKLVFKHCLSECIAISFVQSLSIFHYLDLKPWVQP